MVATARPEAEEYLRFRREAELYRTGRIKKLVQAYYEMLLPPHAGRRASGNDAGLQEEEHGQVEERHRPRADEHEERVAGV